MRTLNVSVTYGRLSSLIERVRTILQIIIYFIAAGHHDDL